MGVVSYQLLVRHELVHLQLHFVDCILLLSDVGLTFSAMFIVRDCQMY